MCLAHSGNFAYLLPRLSPSCDCAFCMLTSVHVVLCAWAIRDKPFAICNLLSVTQSDQIGFVNTMPYRPSMAHGPCCSAPMLPGWGGRGSSTERWGGLWWGCCYCFLHVRPLFFS